MLVCRGGALVIVGVGTSGAVSGGDGVSLSVLLGYLVVGFRLGRGHGCRVSVVDGG